jgi:hypothetical protein
LDRSTIAGNTAGGAGGGLYSGYYAEMTIDDSIISGNSANSGQDVYGAAYAMADLNFSANYSIVQDTAYSGIVGGTGNQLGVDPLLGPLQDNGGPTLTMLPSAVSPATDMADPAALGAFDQRGFPRIQNGRMDIGSVESHVDVFPPDGDFNGDGTADCDDVNALTLEINTAMPDVATYDLTADGLVNDDDLVEWLILSGARAEYAAQTAGNPFFRGDANLDGVVDGLDFITWNDSKFEAVDPNDPMAPHGYCDGDFNGDNVVDGLDFINWNNNKFKDSKVDGGAPNIVLAGTDPSLDLSGGNGVGTGGAQNDRAVGRTPKAETAVVADDGLVRSAMRQQRQRSSQPVVSFAAPAAVTETAVEVSKPTVVAQSERVGQYSGLTSHKVEQTSTQVRRTSDVAEHVSAIDQIFANL